MPTDSKSAEDVFGEPDPTPAVPKAEKRTMTVTKMYKEGGVITHEEADAETIEVHVPHGGIPMANVGFGCRMTVNMGNYETVQLSVDINLPCYLEEMDDCFTAAKRFVDVRLNKEIAELREYRSKKSE